MLVAKANQIRTDKHSTRRGIAPHGIVVHYTAGRDGRINGRCMRERIDHWAGQIAWESSTDVVIGRNPTIDPTVQMVTGRALFERYTWHCGGSVWRGIPENASALLEDAGSSATRYTKPEEQSNFWLVGADLDNYGPLEMMRGTPCYRRTKQQKRKRIGAVPFPGPVFYAKDGCAWEEYTQGQIAELCTMVRRIVSFCPEIQAGLIPCPEEIDDTCPIVGHENIKATKQDPGPAFQQFWPDVYAAAQGG